VALCASEHNGLEELTSMINFSFKSYLLTHDVANDNEFMIMAFHALIEGWPKSINIARSLFLFQA